jgi:hypothetical protein
MSRAQGASIEAVLREVPVRDSRTVSPKDKEANTQ